MLAARMDRARDITTMTQGIPTDIKNYRWLHDCGDNYLDKCRQVAVSPKVT